MASVWVHDKERARKLKGHMSEKHAHQFFDILVRDWRIKGGRVKFVDKMEAVMFDPKGRLICGIYIELYSPPTAPEPGQPKRATA